MYTQNNNLKNQSNNASYKEYPNKNAIMQMQQINKNVNITPSDLRDTIIDTTLPKENKQSSYDLLTTIILILILSDGKINNDTLYSLLIAGCILF